MLSSILSGLGLCAVLSAAATSSLITNTTLATAGSGPYPYYRIVSLQSLGYVLDTTTGTVFNFHVFSKN
jgi:hypothetical protein